MSQENIISLNVDRQISKMKGLAKLARKLKPMAIILQDLPNICNPQIRELCNYDNTADPRMTYYDAYTSHTNRISLDFINDQTSMKRENIIMVDKRIKVKTISLNQNLSELASMLGIQIQLEDGRRFQLYSIYIRPRAEYRDIENIFKAIKNTNKELGNSRTLILGDINAEAAEWAPYDRTILNSHYNQRSDKHYHQVKLSRGRTISTLLKNMKLTILNKLECGPTYYGNQLARDDSLQTAYIDIAAVGNKAHRIWKNFELVEIENENSISKGHLAMVISARYMSQKTPEHRKDITIEERETKYKYPLNRLTEKHFIELKMRLNKKCQDWERLDRNLIVTRMNDIANLTYEHILRAQNSIKIVTTQSEGSFEEHRSRRKLLKQIRNFKRYRQQAKQMKRRNCRPTSRLRATLDKNKYKTRVNSRTKALKMIKRMRARIMHTLKNHIEKQGQFTSKGSNDLWQRIHACNETLNFYQQTLDNDTELESKPHMELDEIIDTKFPYKNRNWKEIEEIESTNEFNPIMPTIVKGVEIEEAMKALRNKKYIGIEGIRFRVFNKAYNNFIPRIIKTICKMSFYTNATPECCHTTIGTLIPKKEQDKYRIVHVSTPLASLLEQIALHRLEYRLEANRLNNPYQYGFRALRGRHDLITRIIELTIKHRNESAPTTYKSRRTTIISLDIEGAFDNVNQDKLITKLMDDLDSDNLKYWLTFFILNRGIVLKHDGRLSKRASICTGVPQGSSLGPTLWNYTINRIDDNINIPGTLELLTYADDLYLIYNGRDQKLLQHKLDLLTQQLANMDLRFSPNKCETMCIYDGTRGQHRHDYRINGQQIQEVKQMKILGITISHLFRLVTDSQSENINRNTELLRRLNYYKVIKEANQWRMIIDSYLKSIIIINNAPIMAVDSKAREWANKTMINCLKIIFRWPQNVSNKLTLLVTNTITAELTIEQLINNKLQTEHNHGYDLLLDVLQGKPHEECRRIRQITDSKYAFKRIQPNPSLFMREPEMINVKNIKQPLWFILERDEWTLTIQLLDRIILQIRGAINTSYPIKYFNTLTAIWQLSERADITDRNIVLHYNSTIMKALRNNKSHDWRIISLRERLSVNNWRIYLMDDRNKRTIYRRLSDVKTCNIDITRAPDLTDYYFNNRKRLEMEAKTEVQMILNRTDILKNLRAKVTTIAQLEPHKLSSIHMQVLSGLYIDESDKIRKAGDECCSVVGCLERAEENLITHRMWECKKYETERATILGITQKPGNLEELMDNSATRGRIFELAIRCTFG